MVIHFFFLTFSQSGNDDDDFIEIIHENSNSTCQQTDNTIIIISDSDDDLSIDVTDDLSSPLSSIIDTIISPSLDNNVEEDHELIDLTEDDANQLERKSSIDVQQCPICLETFSDLQYSGVYLIITPCRHIMCTLCSRQLLITSSRCPLCREKVHSTTLMPYCILT